MSMCPKCGKVEENRLTAFVVCQKCSPQKKKSFLQKHFKYASYVVRHKWFVFVECAKVGMPVRGILHDLSKLLPSEWFPYANFFYDKNPRDKTGYYKPTDTGDKAFDFAWLLHQKRNRHHWQWWILPEDNGGVKVLEMSPEARQEMLCDWQGASKAQGAKTTVLEWYVANREKMRFGPKTQAWIEQQLGYDTLMLQKRAADLKAREAEESFCFCCGHKNCKHGGDNCGACLEGTCMCVAMNHYDGGRCDLKTSQRIPKPTKEK